MSLNIRYASKGEVIDKEWTTRSYYSRHELQARASRGAKEILNFEFWILNWGAGVQAIMGAMRAMGAMGVISWNKFIV